MNIVKYNLGLLLRIPPMLILFYFLQLLWQDNCQLESAAAMICLLQRSQKPSKGKFVFFYTSDVVGPGETFPNTLVYLLMQFDDRGNFFLKHLNISNTKLPRILQHGWKSLLTIYPQVF